MAKTTPKITLSASRDIPFDKLFLSDSNVRRVKNGVTIEDLADDIERRGLLHGLNVRPEIDDDGNETGRFGIPAGGRRYSALAILVKRKRMDKTCPVPCIVKSASDPILAEEDSLAENSLREPLHPLDEFRGMKLLHDKGEREQAIAAHFRVTPAVVTQRLRLASVSPKLHEVYAAGDMTLDQFECELEAAAGVDRHVHRVCFAEAGEVAVARIAGVGHQYGVAGTGQQSQRQQQCAGCARGDDDAPGFDRGLPARSIQPGDGCAQFRQAQGAGVVRMAGTQRSYAGLDDGRGRGEVGFADFEMNDVAAGCFQGLCPRQDIHDVKGCDVVDTRGRPRPFRIHASSPRGCSGCWR